MLNKGSAIIVQRKEVVLWVYECIMKNNLSRYLSPSFASISPLMRHFGFRGMMCYPYLEGKKKGICILCSSLFYEALMDHFINVLAFYERAKALLHFFILQL